MLKPVAACILSALVIGATAACQAPGGPAPTTVTTSAESVAPADLSSEPASPTTVTMPSVEGQNLMEAMDTLDQLGVTDILPRPNDGHAFVANPANWVVAAQDPTAGTELSTADEVTLQVSKTDEAESSWCGDRDC
ncbi:PASTA domain-containing protein [Prauserella aidingensis]|nr:PASTA domain-containing protein [Prauserella aidingensis]